MKRGLQKFSKEYVAFSKKLTPEQRVQFVENYMKMAYLAAVGRRQDSDRKTGKSKLISIKIPADLLELFKFACQAQNIPYQTQIKILMRQWLLQDGTEVGPDH